MFAHSQALFAMMKDGKRDWAVAVPVRFLFDTTAHIIQRSVEDNIMYFELRSRAQDTRETRPGRCSEQIPVFVQTFRRLTVRVQKQ